MNEDQFLAVARKWAADYRLQFVLTFQIDVYNSFVNFYKAVIIQKKTKSNTILEAYKSFVAYVGTIPEKERGFVICAYVELENDEERNDIIHNKL